MRKGGFQGFVQSVRVFGDKTVCRGENFGSGAVVDVQDYRLRAGKIFGEVVEKLHVRAAPGINGLVGIAHDKQISVFARKYLCQRVLLARHVLKFVNLNVFEFVLPFFARFFIRFEQIEHKLN